MEDVVRLTARAEVAYGEELLVCGSAPALGSWKVADSPTMTWSEGGKWILEVGLPCGVTVEMKVLVRQQGGALRWAGAGPTQEANVVLETSLGRGGARPSRFVNKDKLPFALEVEDVAVEAQPAADSVPPQQQAQQPQPGVVAQQPVGAIVQPGAMAPYGQPASLGPPMGYAAYPPQQPESAAAAMLAGAAGAAGRAVTYTTTTTTTTAVTINNPWEGASPSQPAISYAPGVAGGPPGAYGAPPGGAYGGPPGGAYGGPPGGAPPGNALPAPPQAGGSPPGSPQGGGGGGGGAAPEATPAQREAFVNARRKNEGYPRLGPVALSWPAKEGSEPSEVLVRGSWDGWLRDVAMEPAPGGGFRLLMVLPPGQYELKFIVDGNWTTSDEMETTDCVNKNNVVTANDMALAPYAPPTLKDDAAENCTALAVAGG